MAGAPARLQNSITRLNPGVDVSGPISDFFINPFGQEVDDLDNRIDVVKRMFDGEYDPTRSEEEIIKITQTRGVYRDPGKYATGRLAIRSASIPNNLRITAGTICSTIDNVYQYVTMTDFSPTSDELTAGWNSAISQYEYFVPIQAIQIGSKYNIAATRIRTIAMTLPAGCYVINTEMVTGGTDEQSLEDLWNEYKEAAVVSDGSSKSGIGTDLIATYPDLKSVFIQGSMQPASPLGSTNPTINIYAIGEVPVEQTATFVVSASGQITLPYSFILSVASIKRGSENIVLFSVEGNTIQLAEAYTAGESLIVTYTYNKLLNDVQAGASSQSDDLFSYNIKVWEGVPEDLRLRVLIRLQAGIAGSSAEADATSILLDHFNSLYFSNSDINQTDVTELLKANMAGIISAKIMDLTVISQTQQLTGFPLFIAPPKYARLLSDNLTVQLQTS